MIGGCDDDAVEVVLFEELQERVEDATDLTDLVLRCAIGTKRVELVEQVDRSRFLNGVKDQPQLGSGLAKVLVIRLWS